MSPPPDLDALSLSELKSLVLKLLEERAEFQRTVGALRDEIARLKGGPGRPDIKANVKPSGMEKASEAQPANPSGERRGRGATRGKLTIHEEHKLEVAPPFGSRFKGYAGFLVQDLVIRPHVTHFQRECWRTPDGRTVMAPCRRASRAILDPNCVASCSPNIIRGKSRRLGWSRCCEG